jgi:hypothetical protein
MSTTTVVLVFAIVATALAGLFLWLRARSRKLQDTFGPEYDRTVHELGSYKGEFALEKRAKRVKQLEIRELSPADRERFSALWRPIQAAFVDNPQRALTDADLLVIAALTARGYPLQDFDECAEDLSVDHAVVVNNYRIAHDIALRNARGEASTEELRQAMIHYRALFDDLLPAAAPAEPRLRRVG